MIKVKLVFMIAMLLVGTILIIEDVPAAPQCSSHSTCSDIEYCDGFICQPLSLCGKRGPKALNQIPQTSSEDNRNECISIDSCTNQYTISSLSGFCDGSIYDCEGASQEGIHTGMVCQNGGEISPNNNNNCGFDSLEACYCDNDWYQCDSVNDCTYDEYLVGFSSSVCTATGAVLRNQNVYTPEGDRCKIGSTTAYQSQSSVFDANSCGGGGADYCSSGICGQICPTIGADKFRVENSVGLACFEVDTDGDAIIYGWLQQNCNNAPPADSFVLKTASTVYGWIGEAECDMCIYGNAVDSTTVSYSGDALYVMNREGNFVMKWDTAGDLTFEGNACYNYYKTPIGL